MSLVARHLEANGIATVTFSNARDITASACNPRTVFTDYPLGNACGRPHQRENQREVLRTGFRQLESATEPGTIVDTPFRWSADEEWKRLVFTNERPWLSEQAEAERRAILERNRSARP
ncbi:MAG: hypothetical protein HY423_00500 [Candidatus Lambdaproteobacteria bacterium]|nr:hypothetical protein [Candidatus Lambdaproteobacteria bacterium]